MVAGNIVNAVLDPIFIFGWLGFPALGVTGSAWATMIGRIVGVVILVHAFVTGRTQFDIKRAALAPKPALLGRILNIGVFASVRGLVGNVALLALMRLVAEFGTVPVAAYGIGMRLRMFIMGPSMGFGTAAAALVGQNLGAGQPERARKAGWMSIGLCSIIVLLFAATFFTLGEPIVSLFNTDEQVIMVGAELMRWFSAAFLFMSLALVLGQAMNGAGDTVAPMVVTAIATLGFGVPLAYILAYSWESASGVWVAIAASHVFEGLLFAAAFRLGRWEAVGLKIRDAAMARG